MIPTSTGRHMGAAARDPLFSPCIPPTATPVAVNQRPKAGAAIRRVEMPGWDDGYMYVPARGCRALTMQTGAR